MAIHIERNDNIQHGIAKVLDESGVQMLFDNFQKYQYNYPIKSTVREILSNGVDSLGEKHMAREILSGRAKVSDYFEERDGLVYRDSKWDPSYYNLKYFDNVDLVSLTYIVGSNMQKDKVIMKDTGVGLGGKRLEKYFRLGFSTKRLQRKPLGKFGVGAKAPLSIGVNFYTMETCHNGRKFKFNIFSENFTPLIPKFNLETGKENDYILFNEGTEDEVVVYYEETNSKNYVQVTIEAKQSHRAQYIDAVKSQMLYFDNISCQVLENGNYTNIDYKAQILYEDDYIILSNNNYYTQPHLLLNKVNYGFIDWNELELETKKGNIGIKVAPEDVEVNTSREAVIWSEPTKQMVLQRFNTVVDIATNMIQKELTETDIIKWIKTCYQISGAGWSRREGVIGRLANIVDLSKVDPKFGPFPQLMFKSRAPLPGIYIREVSFDRWKGGEVVRNHYESLQGFVDNTPIYLFKLGERSSNKKDKWLLTKSTKFLLFHEPYKSKEEMEEDNASVTYREFYSNTYGTHIFHREIWDLLCKSSEVKWYEDVEVPEDFGKEVKVDIVEPEKPKEPTPEEIEQEKLSRMTAAERRKATGKTIIYTPAALADFEKKLDETYDENADPDNPNTEFQTQYMSGTGSYRQVKVLYKKSAYSFSKIEIPISKINEWKGEIYYGNEADSEMLHFVALLTRDPMSIPGKSIARSYATNYYEWEESKWYRQNKDVIRSYHTQRVTFSYQHFFDGAITLIKIAQSSNKLYRDFHHVQEFFIQIKNKTITMSNVLIQWNTARIIKSHLEEFKFLTNFEEFNPELAELAETLRTYFNKHYREMSEYKNKNIVGLGEGTYDDLISHLDSVRKFQEFVIANKDPKAIADLAGELFGNPELRDGMAVDPEVIDTLNKVLEFSVACGVMLNYIPVLAHENEVIPPQLSVEIGQYLEYRGVLNYTTQKQQEKVLEIPPEIANEILDIMHS